MLVKVKGKEQSIKDLEEIINLLEEAKKEFCIEFLHR